MSQQHLKWIELVKERIEKRGWSQTDLSIVVGVSPSAITQLLKDGKGSDDLKLRINKKLRINQSWEKFEEQEKRMNELERTALNEVLRTVRLINEKVAEIGELQSQQELAISYLRGIMDGSVSD